MRLPSKRLFRACALMLGVLLVLPSAMHAELASPAAPAPAATLDLDDVIYMHQAGLEPEAILAELDRAGVRLEVTAEDVVRLGRAGLPAGLVTALRERAEAGRAAGWRTWVPPSRRCSLRLPPGWTSAVTVAEDGVRYTLRPAEQVLASPAGQALASPAARAELTLRPADTESPGPYHQAAEVLVRRLRAEGVLPPPGDAAKPVPVERILHGVPAAELRLEQDGSRNRVGDSGGPAGKETALHLELLLAHDGFEHRLQARAPLDAGDPESRGRAEALLDGLVQGYDPRRPPLDGARRLPRSLEASDLIDRYLPSVVRIHCPGLGTGTGFFVRADGYVLTNHHVVWDEDRSRYAPEILVEWDRRLALPPAPARLIRAVREGTPRLDLALLQLEALPAGLSGFPAPLPMCPESEIRNEDPVFTMGFPLGDILSEDSITTTGGSVSHLSFLADGRVDTIFTTSEINPGSSGGPCMNLKAGGGVIGLNTFTFRYMEWLGRAPGYFGVLPIERAMSAMPELAWYPPGPAWELSARDHLRLGNLFERLGQLDAAASEFLLAHIGDPAMAEASARQGDLAARRGRLRDDADWVEDARGHYEDALELDPGNRTALTGLARLAAGNEDYETALALYGRALDTPPPDPALHSELAALLARLERWDQAQEQVERALQLDGGFHPDPYRGLGQVLTRRAAAAADTGHADKARRLIERARTAYEAALAVAPGDLESRYGLAELHKLAGQPDEAAEAYRAIAEDCPDDPTVARRAAEFFEDQGAWDEALDHYLRAADLYALRSEDDDTSAALMSVVRIAEGDLADPDLALDTYIRLLGQPLWDGAKERIWFRMAEIYEDRGEPMLAFCHYAMMLTLSGEDDREGRVRLARFDTRPLTRRELGLLVSRGYPEEHLESLVLWTGVDFPVTLEIEAALRREGWPGQLIAFLQSVEHALAAGDYEPPFAHQLGIAPEEADLAGGVAVEVSDFHVAHDGMHASFRVTNGNDERVSDVRLYVTWRDADGAVLMAHLLPGPLAHALEAGEVWNVADRLVTSWKELEGIDDDELAELLLEVTSAREAGWYQGLAVDAVELDRAGPVFRCRLTNGNDFPVLVKILELDYLDAAGKTLLTREVAASSHRPTLVAGSGLRLESGESALLPWTALTLSPGADLDAKAPDARTPDLESLAGLAVRVRYAAKD